MKTDRDQTTREKPRRPIYMDCHATTPVDPRVLEAMLPYFSEEFGNAASRNHRYGWEAAKAVDLARQRIADLIGATPAEIIFTSGATESDNLALRGVVDAYAHRGRHIITDRIEHRAVLDTAAYLEKTGVRVTYLPVGRDGVVDPDDIRRAVTDQTILISVMHANNEIGTIQPIRAIGRIAREHGILFHTDAVQAAGKLPISVDDDGIDLLSLSAHKVYGPKGIGTLYVRRRKPRVRLRPLVFGGGHERGMRSGTLAVPLIVGFGAALEIAGREMDEESRRIAALRDRLKRLITSELDGVFLNGSETQRLPHNLNLSFAHVDAEAILVGMPDVALSTGSACSSARQETSHVLEALGIDSDRVHSSIRFGLGRFNTEWEVEYVAARVVETVRRLRAISPLYNLKQKGRQNARTTSTEH